jgi:hypothetical protein
VKTSNLPLPPMEELVAMGTPRAYGPQGSMAGAPYAQTPNYPPYGTPPGYAPPPGPPLGYFPQQQAWGPPPQSAPPSPPPASATHAAPPPGFGAPQVDPQVADLRAQVGFLSGQLQSVLEALSRQGDPRAAVAAAAAAAQAPPSAPVGVAGPPTVDQIAAAVLRMMGHTPVTAAQAQAAPPPSATAAAGLAEMKSMVETFKSLRGVFRDFDEAFQPDEPPVEEAVVKPPVEGASLPFDVIELPAPFLGHPGKYARNKETGGFDLQGFLLSNPGFAEKGMEVLEKAAEGLQTLGKHFGLGGAPKDAPAPPPSPLENSGLDFGDDGAAGQLGGPAPTGWPET